MRDVTDLHYACEADDEWVCCPTCSRAVLASLLCECEDDDYGPLCTPACCRNWHQDTRDPLEVA